MHIRLKNSGEIRNKLKSRGFLASGLSTYDFSTLYTTLPHNLKKEKLTELIKQTFNREGSLYLACNETNSCYNKVIDIIKFEKHFQNSTTDTQS